jgi:GMP synthase-like glutamine amidotransferase
LHLVKARNRREKRSVEKLFVKGANKQLRRSPQFHKIGSRICEARPPRKDPQLGFCLGHHMASHHGAKLDAML